MRTSDFHYELPPELIARYPVEPRSASRLLLLDSAGGGRRDLTFTDLPSLLRPDDLLVFNDTRVIPARLFGAKETGGRIEVLIERVLDPHKALAQVRASKPPKSNQRLDLEGGVTVQVLGRRGEFYELDFGPEHTVIEQLERVGHMPLPPYITRADEPTDRERYQTVYARASGAVAAPTAGLHFDEPLLTRLKALGVEFGYLTLHVGAGTFQPVRSETLAEHRMHAEYLKLSPVLCDQVNAARAAGRRVVAVGTTVVRALESATGEAGRLAPFEGETDIFIYPGYRFRAVDALLTNFHLPGSTLLMLVCAFGGTAAVLAAYRHAVATGYRFYSYGDAMFVTPGPTNDRP
ncbi:MAG: tRNA preQ1(34) S-adenosylmethionine ribosyltransferase-isomerase QueA [Gammaproteobacteria bacterium]|nr:tRNA preQ1(34) S-adenosylmethionine ribosyltransferase-isomerase QueA [Gammaproteobacteria bacterium]